MLKAFVVMLALLLGAGAVALAVALLLWAVLRIFHVERKGDDGDDT